MSTSTLLPTERIETEFELADDRRLAQLAEAIRTNRYQVDGMLVADSMLRWVGRA